MSAVALLQLMFHVDTLAAGSINSGLTYQADNHLHVTARPDCFSEASEVS